MNVRRAFSVRVHPTFLLSVLLASATAGFNICSAEDDWLPEGPGIDKSTSSSTPTSGASPLRLPGKQLLAGKQVRRNDDTHSQKSKWAISSMIGSLANGTKRFFSKTVDVLTSPFSSKQSNDERSSRVVSRYPRHAGSTEFPIASARRETGGRRPQWPFGSLFKNHDDSKATQSPNEWIMRPRP